VGEDFRQTAEVVGIEFDFEGGYVFLQIFAPLSAGDGNKVIALGQNPCQC